MTKHPGSGLYRATGAHALKSGGAGQGFVARYVRPRFRSYWTQLIDNLETRYIYRRKRHRRKVDLILESVLKSESREKGYVQLHI